MTLFLKKHITRSYIQQSMEVIFLFGDNMQRTGLGGQAQEMRGEPNSLGVPTKWSPYTGDAAYFSDDDFFEVKKYIDFPFDVAIAWLRYGRDVVIPSDGFGTGLAQLSTRAPSILEHIELRIFDLTQASTTLKEIL